MSVPAYPEYKESGVAWLGEVPSHWSVAQTKRYFRRRKETNAGMICDDRLALTMNGVIPRSLDDLDGLQSSDYEGYQIFEPGDLAFKLIDLQNIKTSRVGMVPTRGIMSPAYIRLEPINPQLGQFGFWYFMALYWTQVFNNLGGGVRQTLGPEELLTVAFPLPTAEEQTAIAAFLDRETAKIDRLVAEQERLIALLKEKRQAVISHAVTKGLNAQAPMKDSGIEWLGEVPAHWDHAKFVRVVSIAEGQVDPKEAPYSDMVLIAPNHVESGTGRLIALETAAEQNAESGKYQAQMGDVIYSKIRPALAKSVIAPLDCLCSADMYPLKPCDKITAAFLNFFILSPAFTAWATLESDRVAMPKINREKLNEVVLAIPPLEEQSRIVSVIELRIRDFDALEAEAQSAITLLQERRAALISAAVTGKIDVRGLVPAELEAA